MSNRKHTALATDLLGNIYDVFDEGDSATRIRRVQIIKVFANNTLGVKQLERFDHSKRRLFFDRISIDTPRQKHWRLIEHRAALQQPPPRESDSPAPEQPVVLKGRGPRIPAGEVIDDVRVGDVWEAHPSIGNTTAMALVKVTAVDRQAIHILPYERQTPPGQKPIRLCPVVRRESWRNGRYRLIERDPQAPPAPPRMGRREEMELRRQEMAVEPEPRPVVTHPEPAKARRSST